MQLYVLMLNLWIQVWYAMHMVNSQL
jgi:hypothetical protein